jgi:hypothetical protein
MCGVLVAPYMRPTTPFSSSSTAVGAALRVLVSSSAWAGVMWPCVPGDEEIRVSQTTPWPVTSRCSDCMLPVS